MSASSCVSVCNGLAGTGFEGSQEDHRHKGSLYQSAIAYNGGRVKSRLILQPIA